jgi:hypothetical protein
VKSLKIKYNDSVQEFVIIALLLRTQSVQKRRQAGHMSNKTLTPDAHPDRSIND